MQPRGQGLHIRFTAQHLNPRDFRQFLRHGDGRRGPQIIDIGFESQAQRGDAHGLGLAPAALGQEFAGLGHHVIGTGVIDFACRANQARQLRRGVHDEPRIHRDAVPAHSRSGTQNVDAGVQVRQLDQLPHVDPQAFRYFGQFVGEGDVDVAERVLGQLGQLGGFRVGQANLSAAESPIELCRFLSGLRGQAADNAVIGENLYHDFPWQHAFGAVREQQLSAQFRPVRLDAGRQGLGGSRRRSGLQHHQGAFSYIGGNLVGGCHDIGQVSLVIAFERSGDRHDEYFCRTGLQRGGKQTAGMRFAQGLVQSRLQERYLAGVHRVYVRRVGVHAFYGVTGPGQSHRGGQADVTQTNNCYSFRVQGVSFLSWIIIAVKLFGRSRNCSSGKPKPEPGPKP